MSRACHTAPSFLERSLCSERGVGWGTRPESDRFACFFEHCPLPSDLAYSSDRSTNHSPGPVLHPGPKFQDTMILSSKHPGPCRAVSFVLHSGGTQLSFRVLGHPGHRPTTPPHLCCLLLSFCPFSCSDSLSCKLGWLCIPSEAWTGSPRLSQIGAALPWGPEVRFAVSSSLTVLAACLLPLPAQRSPGAGGGGHCTVRSCCCHPAF